VALSQSALSGLLEAFRAGDGVDLIRELVRVVLQEWIAAEAIAAISARDAWRCSTWTATLEQLRRSTAASRHRRSTAKLTTPRGTAVGDALVLGTFKLGRCAHRRPAFRDAGPLLARR
jgi:hypothetical protein